MNEPDLRSDDAKLDGLLREARSSPALPPRFQENVWRRIEDTEKRNVPIAEDAWFHPIASWILRPRRVVAVAAVLVIAGVGTGWSSGERLAREDAQARYMAVVAPNTLR